MYSGEIIQFLFKFNARQFVFDILWIGGETLRSLEFQSTRFGGPCLLVIQFNNCYTVAILDTFMICVLFCFFFFFPSSSFNLREVGKMLLIHNFLFNALNWFMSHLVLIRLIWFTYLEALLSECCDLFCCILSLVWCITSWYFIFVNAGSIIQHTKEVWWWDGYWSCKAPYSKDEIPCNKIATVSNSPHV